MGIETRPSCSGISEGVALGGMADRAVRRAEVKAARAGSNRHTRVLWEMSRGRMQTSGNGPEGGKEVRKVGWEACVSRSGRAHKFGGFRLRE